MKIRPNDYAGLVFLNTQHWLFQRVYHRAHEVAAATQPGQYTYGTLMTPNMYRGRLEYMNALMSPKGFTHYLITPQAQKIAEAVKIEKNFNWRLLKPLRQQASCYLLNENEFIRFISTAEGIVIFYMKAERDAQQQINNYTTKLLQIDYETGVYIVAGVEKAHVEVAHRLARIITFVEMSEPEILVVDARSDSPNRKAPLADRIENKADVAITRVHSSWNKFIINTAQIGVKGFLRLQACGPQWSQRKLTWVQAHTRNGFKRRSNGGKSLS